MHYLAYEFTVTPVIPGNEVLMAFLEDFPFDSFEENETGFIAYINTENQINNAEIDSLKLEDILFSYAIKKIETVNWNQEWENNFKRVDIENLLSIRAPFHEINKNTKHTIIITPKMSFGTGHHQTTQLMCELMATQNFKNTNVLDMGCGTGVLTIFSELLGAKTALGIDIDDWSIENSIENAKMNNCNSLSFLKGNVETISTKSPYDIILANINKNVLKAQMNTYSTYLKSNGLLLLSGFFITDIDELIEKAKQQQLSFITKKSNNEWAALLFTRN
ncbi:MAG: 50S ribosomal protein L11 methyltransferase [Bacteroidetes bacterium]|nr:50S ribosomal protein L11 methyltransferase [Bacteroidota bacterium]